LSENTAVPLVVVSSSRDPVEALNSLLRKQGVAAHCTWIPAIADLPDALTQLNPQMLLLHTADGGELPEVAQIRVRISPDVPLVVVRTELGEQAMAQDLAAGARDSISLAQSARAFSVIARELQAYRGERELRQTLQAVQEYRRQLDTVLTRSNDAIAQVQEGIVVDVNQSWLDLIAAVEARDVVGQPVMDFFEESSHAALKGALVACLKGHWKDHSLRADVRTADGGTLALELVLTLGQRDGEPCVRLMVPSQKRGQEEVARDLTDAVKRNPRTGLLYRVPLLDAIHQRMASKLQAGGRYLVHLRPDGFARLEKEMGVIASEDLLVALAGLVRQQLTPTDLAGHFSGPGMLILAERGTPRDVEAWTQRLLEKIAQQEFQVGERIFRTTASAGMATLSGGGSRLAAALIDVQDVVRRGRAEGGNLLVKVGQSETEARAEATDASWVKQIRAALTANRFTLVQQPITSLAGGPALIDTVVRMKDAQGREILPGDFMPSAERSGLVGLIDRWVIAHAAKLALSMKAGCVFVRISRHSALEVSLPTWIAHMLQSTGLAPQHLCIEVTESITGSNPADILRLANALKKSGIRFALEHYGTGIDPLSMLGMLPLDFVKIDGSLMQGLTTDTLLQSKVGSLIEAASERGIATIAERVEDANTMAVLWQLGVQHVQGFLFRASEEVVLA
jgi:EAL domain-containing protein (putative c-di-GMP-specific phosphodiesterase class I)/GGDEF domain-containing protein